jgi:hypothetical protein
MRSGFACFMVQPPVWETTSVIFYSIPENRKKNVTNGVKDFWLYRFRREKSRKMGEPD